MPPTHTPSSPSSNALRLSRGACCALLAVPMGIGVGLGCGGSKSTGSTSGFGGTAATTSTTGTLSGTTTGGPGGMGGNIFQSTSTGSMGTGGGDVGCDTGTPTKGPTQWAQKNSEMSGTQNVLGVAADVSGNVLVAGSAGKNSSITLGSLAPVAASSNVSNAFVAQIAPDGTPSWDLGIVTSGSSSNGVIDSTARAVTTDEQGNVYVGGDFNGTITLGSLSITSAGTGHFFGDAFVAEFDSTGKTPKALLRFGDSAANTPSNGGGAQQVQGLAIHTGATGDELAVVGQFESELDLTVFPNGTLLTAGTNSNHQPVGFLVVLRVADDSVVFSTQFGDGTVQQSAFGVAFDATGDVLVTGNTTGAINFPSGPMLTPTGGQAAFVAKIKSDGSATSWANLYGDTSASGAGIATDAAGDVFVAGQHTGTVDFGGGPSTAVGGSNAFVAKLDTNGKYVWAHSYGDGSAQEATGIAVDATGHAIVTGAFEGTMNFGTSGLTTLTSAGQDDIFVAKLDTHGCVFWSKSFGDAQEQSSNAVAVDAMGNAVIAGNMFGTVNFGPGPLTAPPTTENLFIAKFGP